MGLEVTTAEDREGARAIGRVQFLPDRYALAGWNGLDIVEEVAERYPNLPIAVITAHGKIEDAVYALKVGAFDFVSKPVDLAVLRKLVNTALKIRKSEPVDASPPERGRRQPPRFGTRQAHRVIACHAKP